MTTLLEDLRAELRQMCRAIGLSGTAATVVPLVLLGIALNVAALSVVGGVRPVHASACKKPALRSVAMTELKVARAVLVSTLKTIGDGRRRWCSARQGLGQQVESAGMRVEVGFARLNIAPRTAATKGCSKS
ncbi:hypothetical protein [Tunturiibacter lichenicola]|uniref:hypothetical protein n=1 Tax=Tunturiibacter lichenicola TaxID=2051959 RepID=UPI003D9BD5DC